MNLQLDAGATCDSFSPPCPIVFLRLSWIPPSEENYTPKILPSRPFTADLFEFLPFSSILFFLLQKWYKKCCIFHVSTASAIARMSSSFSGRNTMTSSNLTRNMTPLWIAQKHGKLVFFSAKSCLSKHLLGKQPVEEFWSEETLHLLKQLKVSKMTCETLNDNAMLGIWRSHCSLFVTPLWSFVKFMHLSVVYLCLSVQANAPHPLLPSPSHRCQSHPPGIDIDWLEASRTWFHMFSSCFHLVSFLHLSIPFHPFPSLFGTPHDFTSNVFVFFLRFRFRVFPFFLFSRHLGVEAKPRGAGGALGDGAAADVRRHDDLVQILKEAKMAGFLRRKFDKRI